MKYLSNITARFQAHFSRLVLTPKSSVGKKEGYLLCCRSFPIRRNSDLSGFSFSLFVDIHDWTEAKIVWYRGQGERLGKVRAVTLSESTGARISLWILRSAVSINQTSIAPISPAKPGSVVRHPNQCSTAKSRQQFRYINRPWGVTVSMGERPNQRDVSSDIS